MIGAAATGLPPGTPVELVALSGDKVTPASVHRDAGLDAVVAAQAGGALLRQRVQGRWLQDRGYELTLGLLQRWPQLRAVWAANDPMALGALSAARESGRVPGRDIFIAGLNWSAEALRAVVGGDLVVSVGGHFMAGGWSMVLLRDYHEGHDFAAEGAELGLAFEVLDAGNAGRYLARFGDGDWRAIDFRRFSRSYNSDQRDYDFGPERLLGE